MRFKPGNFLVLSAALPVLILTSASLGQAVKWDLQGNLVLPTDFLGSLNDEEVRFRTDNIKRMEILGTDPAGPSGGVFPDLDGAFRIYTNLFLDPFPGYRGNIIMSNGTWHGGINNGVEAGNLDLYVGDVAIDDGDLLMRYGSWLGRENSPLDAGNLTMTQGDLWVDFGNAFIGPKPFVIPTGTNLLVSSGQVLIGDPSFPAQGGQGPVNPPPGEPVLRIDGYGHSPKFGIESNHVVFIRSYDDPNDNFDTPDGIAIQLEHDPNTASATETANFITFYDGFGAPQGAIEGGFNEDPPVGVIYRSNGADFAEFLEKLNPADEFEPGEIVGVFGGKISHQIDGADHILVISTSPVVLGNGPLPELEHLYARVAFLGQVPTLVVGEANSGDYIIPSGLNDGTGLAVSAAAIQPQDLSTIVGTVWSVSEDGQVNVAVGFKAINWGNIIQDNPAPNHEVDIEDLKDRVDALESIIERLLRTQNRETRN